MNVRMLLAVALATCLSPMASDDMGIKNQEKKSFQNRISKDLELEYLLFLPEGYKEDSSKQWPLMLFLHGAGERGTNIAKVTVHGPPKIVKDRPDFPFILVSPQCPSGQTWSDETLLALLDEVIGEHRVDKSRIYLTGLSMGGYGTWSLGLKHPDRFAAIAPICGGGTLLPLLLPGSGKQAALKRLPVWAFHGAKDELVVQDESERMVNALKSIGNQTVKLTVYPEAGHDSWTETYNNEDLYQWFLEHKITAKPSTRKKANQSNRPG